MPLVVRVLGSAAGGGVPQWNSAGMACVRARQKDPSSPPRGQTSLCVSADGMRFFLLDTSPDLRSQIEATPALHPNPSRGLRHTPLLGAALTGADVDRIAGLLSLREAMPLALYATNVVHAALDENPIFEVLSRAHVPRRALPLHNEIELLGPNDERSGLLVEAFVAPGKAPLWLEGRKDAMDPGYTIGLAVRAAGGAKVFHYIPGCAAMTNALRERIRGSALAFLDGTLFDEFEMITTGAGPKTGTRMGHVSMSGPAGSIEGLEGLAISRKIFIHLNNTNPVLLADSPERHFVEDRGWEVAYDGMEIVL